MTFFQIGVTYVTLPIFKGFRAFSGGWHSKSKVTENRFTTKSKQRKNQAVPPWASASSAGPLFALLLSSKYVQNIDSFSPVLTRLYL